MFSNILSYITSRGDFNVANLYPYQVWFSWPLACDADLSFAECSAIREDYHYAGASSTQRPWSRCCRSPPPGHSWGWGCLYPLPPHQSPLPSAFGSAKNCWDDIASEHINARNLKAVEVTYGSDSPFWSSWHAPSLWRAASKVNLWSRAPGRWRAAVWGKAAGAEETSGMAGWNAMRLGKGTKSWSCWQRGENLSTYT